MVKQIQNLNNLAGYVTLQHVLQARDVLIKNNKNQKNNNLVYYNHHANLGHFVVQFEDDKNKQYKPNELLRIAYLIYQNVDTEDESQIAENYKNLDNVLSNNLADADEANSFLNNLQSEKDTNLRSEEDTAEIVRNGVVLQESRHKLRGRIVKAFEPDKFGKSPKAKATVEAIAVGRSYREILRRGGRASILRRMDNAGFITWTRETPLEFKIIDTRANKIVDGDSAVVVIKPEDDEMDENVKLLKQFKQMIFYGPPGTGKTYNAKWTLRELFGVNKDELPDLQGDQWDIVQFHPSYNYEDFVRGVQVNTNDEGQIKYETKNRIFAEMCDKASQDKDNAYALIIDEINRANVSSVLGELIYALEYRGESVSTPYEIIGSRLLTIPPNLYIIGTMNTADRTIGALDYAVRRRFAFVHCPPDESLIADAKAKSMFGKVKHIFAKFLSPDFDAADVEIGHSYFMAQGEELLGKIQYQVIPILEEYVKDGVLLPEAKEKIKELLQEKRESEPPQPRPPRGQFRWTRDGRSDTNGVGRTVLSIIRDYVEHKDPQLNLEELQQAFPDHLAPGNRRTVASENDPDVLRDSSRYFMNHPIILLNGESTVVCREWGVPGIHWADFKNQVRYLGYTITEVE